MIQPMIAKFIFSASVLFIALSANDKLAVSQSSTPTLHVDKTILLEFERGEFSEIDPQPGDEAILLEFEIQFGQISDYVIDASNQKIYIVEIPGCCGGISAGSGQITEVDLDTGETKVIFEGLNLSEISPIPNSPDLMLSYFDPNLKRIRDEPARHCILNIDLQTCNHEWLKDFESVQWISQYQFIGIVKDDQGIRKSYLVNLENSNRIMLPRAVQYWTPIPSVKDKLLTTGSIAATFDIFDLNTFEAATYRVAGDYDQLSAFYPVSFSPDGRYLLFRYQSAYLIAEFNTGEIVSEFNNTFDPQWLNDSTGIIYLYYPQLGNYPVQVMRYDLATNTYEVLSEFDERISIYVVQ